MSLEWLLVITSEEERLKEHICLVPELLPLFWKKGNKW
jgi:hypothetical protein